MELYNLEKKSDSTRGRKSLDMKHDLLPPLPKQDKISSLLAAAAASSSPSQVPSKSPFGNIISPSMPPYPLGPYFNNMRPGQSPAAAAAAAMMNPMAALGGGLLTSPRFFLGGMNGLPPLSTPGLIPPSLLPSLPNTSMAITNSTPAASLKLPVKMPDLASASPSKLSPNKPQPAAFPASPLAAEADAMPQDLSLKREPATPPKSETPEDLRHQPSTPPPPLAPLPQSLLPSLPPSLHSLPPPVSLSYTTKLDDYTATAAAMMAPIVENGTSIYGSSPRSALLPPTPLLEGCMTTAAALAAHCKSKRCGHEEQLKKLRKNVLRMLSVLTPDIGIENDIDFETDQVDQLLYEVIYSNLD